MSLTNWVNLILQNTTKRNEKKRRELCRNEITRCLQKNYIISREVSQANDYQRNNRHIKWDITQWEVGRSKVDLEISTISTIQ